MRKYSPLPQVDTNLSREFYDISNSINDIIEEVNFNTPITVVGGTNIAVVESPANTYTVSATGLVISNSPISGSTKTKITYDSKGLVTSGADATTADINDSTNKRYVTDAQLTVIGNTSGINTGDITLVGSTNISVVESPSKTFTFSQTGLVISNSPISGSTKTKITYDSKGLVTSGADATTADINDSTNKRYVTDSDLTNLASLASLLNYQKSFMLMGA